MTGQQQQYRKGQRVRVTQTTVSEGRVYAGGESGFEMRDVADRRRFVDPNAPGITVEVLHPKAGDRVLITGMRFSQGIAQLGEVGETVTVDSGPDSQGDLLLITDDGRPRYRFPSEVEVIEDAR